MEYDIYEKQYTGRWMFVGIVGAPDRERALLNADISLNRSPNDLRIEEVA